MLDQFARHDDRDEPQSEEGEADLEAPSGNDGQWISPPANGDVRMDLGGNLDLEG